MKVTPLPFSKDHERLQKEALIMGEAAKLFNENGFRATRHEDLSGAIGLTKTSVSYYFDTKEELALACYGLTFSVLGDCIARATSYQSALETLFSLIRHYGEYWKGVHDQLRLPLAKIYHMPQMSPEGQDALRALSLPVTRFLIDTIRRGQAEGCLKSGGVGELFGFIYNVLQDTAQPVISGSEQTLNAYLRVLKAGLDPASSWKMPAAPMIKGPVKVNASEIFSRKARTKFKRDAFVAAGIRKFNLARYDGVGMTEIAAELGVSRGAFYHHFRDKEALLEAAFESSLETLEGITSEAQADGRSGAEVVALTLQRTMSNNTIGAKPLIRFSMVEDLPRQAQARYTARLAAVTSALTQAIVRGQMDGSLIDAPPAVLQTLVSTLLQRQPINELGVYALEQTGCDQINPALIANVQVSALMNGLAAQQGQ